MKQLILNIPDDDGDYPIDDPRIDGVNVDSETESPYLEEVKVPNDGETSVDRAFVTDERKTLVGDAIADYEAEKEKTEPDVQVQLDALERAISYMWDVVSAEDVGSEALREQSKETDDSTDDSTSA